MIDSHSNRNSLSSLHTPAVPITLTGLRVLLVEDDVDQLATLVEVLSRAGAVVDAVTSAHDALRALARHVPDVIVSEIGMPHCDGYHLLRMVRARPKQQGGATPAIALTGRTTSVDRTRALLASYQLHLAKPVQNTQLIAAIRRLADARSATTS